MWTLTWLKVALHSREFKAVLWWLHSLIITNRGITFSLDQKEQKERKERKGKGKEKRKEKEKRTPGSSHIQEGRVRDVTWSPLPCFQSLVSLCFMWVSGYSLPCSPLNQSEEQRDYKIQALTDSYCLRSIRIIPRAQHDTAAASLANFIPHSLGPLPVLTGQLILASKLTTVLAVCSARMLFPHTSCRQALSHCSHLRLIYRLSDRPSHQNDLFPPSLPHDFIKPFRDFITFWHYLAYLLVFLPLSVFLPLGYQLLKASNLVCFAGSYVTHTRPGNW